MKIATKLSNKTIVTLMIWLESSSKRKSMRVPKRTKRAQMETMLKKMVKVKTKTCWTSMKIQNVKEKAKEANRAAQTLMKRANR